VLLLIRRDSRGGLHVNAYISPSALPILSALGGLLVALAQLIALVEHLSRVVV
jgi:hypothetical protein